MSRIGLPSLVALLVAAPPLSAADEVPPNKQFQAFVRKQAAELRKDDRPPATAEEWAKQEAELRKKLFAAWGGDACFLPRACELDPKQHGQPLKRDGYTVEKITFQTRPGVRMTANLYVPDSAKKKPAPAILMVHGHWRGAKQDPVVQSRCIGAAKLGFVVLCVDAFGAGERGIGTALGEYHGEMTAATLLPLGLPLSGLQVYENMRAVDYLETRPEVDKARIGITGASGGGNQTMYAGAWDRRFKCVVPVCSVGNYQAYLQAACCMCEVVPGALKFTEEWAVLALTAPRPLMVVSATKDAFQFSVNEAKKSLALTAPVYKLLGKPDNLRHAIFESPHAYNQAMREAMYGWMTLHLKGEGKGDPIPEPAIKTENPEDLRCFPGNTRPKDFMTIPKFAAQEGKKLRDARPQVPRDGGAWLSAIKPARDRLLNSVWKGGPEFDRSSAKLLKGQEPGAGARVISYEPEPGVALTATVDGADAKGPLVVLLNLEGAEAARKGELYAALTKGGRARAVTLDLRGTGKLAPAGDKIGRASDHNSAEWALWLGRPLLYQWTADVLCLLPALRAVDGDIPDKVVVIGEGPAGLVALCAAAADAQFTHAAAVNTLASFVTDEPYTNQRLGLMAPGILRDLGDVWRLAALGATQNATVIAGGVTGGGKALSAQELTKAYEQTARAFHLFRHDFRITTPDNVLKELGLVAAQDDKQEKEEEPIFEPGAKLTKLAGGGAAGEGPAWDPKLGVFTSGEKGIYQYTPEGESKLWRKDAGTNGLLFDRDGNLVCCEPAKRSVSRITRDGKRTVLTDNFGGKKYNTPNDLTIDSKNRIYFSDPRYGDRKGMEIKNFREIPIEGVYRIDPDGKVSRVIELQVQRANGVLVSADDKYLFVADNNNDPGARSARKLWRFDLGTDGTVNPASQKLLYDWGKGRGPDGVKQDSKGRLYVAAGLNKPNPPAEPDEKAKGGIYVIDPESGKLLAFVAVPTDEVTNCAFGGDDLKTLYVTGGGTLYSIKTTTPGRVIWPKK